MIRDRARRVATSVASSPPVRRIDERPPVRADHDDAAPPLSVARAPPRRRGGRGAASAWASHSTVGVLPLPPTVRLPTLTTVARHARDRQPARGRRARFRMTPAAVRGGHRLRSPTTTRRRSESASPRRLDRVGERRVHPAPSRAKRADSSRAAMIFMCRSTAPCPPAHDRLRAVAHRRRLVGIGEAGDRASRRAHRSSRRAPRPCRRAGARRRRGAFSVCGPTTIGRASRRRLEDVVSADRDEAAADESHTADTQ